MTALFDNDEGRLAIALGIGLVIGAERERRKGQGPMRVPAGIRTFALVSLLGGVIFALGNPALLVVGAIGVGSMALVSFRSGEQSDPGLTTAAALLLTYCLGALALSRPTLALASGLCAASLLAFRATLHAAFRSVLSEDELRDALLLAIAAVVILPLLPNHTIDPLDVLNPFRLWRLVVAFMGMSALGHVAQRAIGPRYGLAVAGFGSGFVSSAATIAAMGARVRADGSLLGPGAAGVAASSVGTMIQLAILVGAADPHLLSSLGWPLGIGAGVALIYAVLQTWRMPGGDVATVRGHAFKLSTALLFATLVTVVSVVSTLAMRWAGKGGLLIATALAGLADTHSASAAVASVSGSGQVSTATAELGVLLALTTNTVTKCVLALSSGGRVFVWRVIGGLILMTATTWLVYAVGVLR